MTVTLITDHIKQALARRMQQFKNIPAPYTFTPISDLLNPIKVSGWSSILVAFVDQIQLLENATFSLIEGRLLYDGTNYPAIGAQLDIIGTLVGVARNGVADAEYLVFILATIAKNTSDTTIHFIMSIISLLFQTNDPILAFDMYPAEFDFQVPDTTKLQPEFFGFAANTVQSALGAGIGLGFVSLYSPTNAFQFTSVGGPQIGGGFGGLSQPDGGEFAGNIYNNTGV